MLETPEELGRLQDLLDRSAAGAGPHLRGIIFEVNDPSRVELRQAMLDHYLPLQGPSFETWLNEVDGLGARIVADKMFTFRAAGEG
jgi:hypothetical protein